MTAGRAQRQNLPPALASITSPVEEAVGFGTQVADAERTGQGGMVEEETGCTLIHDAVYNRDILRR